MKSVENGVALLNERLPGWRTHIDTDTLDLSDGCNCILGQLFGKYADGVELLGITNPWRYGFIKPARSTYYRLTEAWKKVLA